jgi:hypothetical protein
MKAYPLFSLTAIHEYVFHIHSRLTATQYLDLDVLHCKGDCAGVLDYLFHKKRGMRFVGILALRLEEK